MPLPVIIPVIASAAGLYGTGKTVKAKADWNEAKGINRSAERIIDRSHEAVEQKKNKANQSIYQLGRKKLESLEKNMTNFVSVMSSIKKVELKSIDLDLNINIPVEYESSDVIADQCNFLVESCRGILTGATAGSITAFGAYNGTLLLASSSTGTAISALSGAAETNATLAWLGGGSLASGGAGTAGGAMVLGILLTGPALLVFGSVLGAKSSTSLNDARSSLERAKTFEQELELVKTKLHAVTAVATLAASVLSRIRANLRRATKEIEVIKRQYGVDYSCYPKCQQEVVLKAVKYAQLLRVVIDTPLLDEYGEVIEHSRSFLGHVRAEIV